MTEKPFPIFPAGEHTRPRVFRPAPPPVGSDAPDQFHRCGGFERPSVAGEAPATAPEAGALPKSTAWLRFWTPILLGSLLINTAWSVSAAESWADERLPVTNGLQLWFDASRQNAGRSSLQLPTLAAGNSIDYLLDASGRRRHLTQPVAERRPRFRQEFTGAFLSFDGKDDSLDAALLGESLTNATVFLVAAPRSNAGMFRGFFGFSQAGRNDYTSGLNLDLGPGPTPRLSLINAEGAGCPGVASLWKGAPLPFGAWHTFALMTQPGPQGVQLHADATAQGTRNRQPGLLRLDSFALGARHYSNSGEPPFTQGFFHGELAEFFLYNRVLPADERIAVEKYLAAKYAALLALPPIAANDGSRPLATVTNPAPVQMFVPGFIARELPVSLNNINNLKYRPDGKLVTVGYNGHVWLLSDTDGDGLEDKVEPFWEKDSVRAPIGLALTPPGYARGQGVFVTGKGKVSLIVDTNRDDRADEEILVASWKEPSVQHGVDGLGVALDQEGNIYFGLGAASFTGAYLIDKTTGQSGYSLESERGTILKVSSDFKKREIVCTGIRFPVALAFNRAGDLFCTDQEGATWLPNGNPLDELVHIQPGRHYGFPPRHPKHLPNVADEPSVFDYAPQHQSTCGLNFNELPVGTRVTGDQTSCFGPAWWKDDALVTGYSRGKLYRTKLVKTAAGYVAQNQLIACLSSLPVDACVSPRGELVVATHSGQPDWGSGPNGEGKLYQIRYSETKAPQPVLAWSASPTEIRVAFDRPLDPAHLRNLTKQTSITQGKYVFAGDRFETLRPGYQVIYDQLTAPRYDVPVLSASLAADQRTLLFVTPPRAAAVNYALTLPGSIVGARVGGLASPSADDAKRSVPRADTHDEIDLLADLGGVETVWVAKDGKTNWSGWLPHLDLQVARELTGGSAEHDRLWDLVKQPGQLVLRTQLDLWQMLQPATQPGSKLDFEPSPEEVTVNFHGLALLKVKSPAGRAIATDVSGAKSTHGLTMRSASGRWEPVEVEVPTGPDTPAMLRCDWRVLERSELVRAFPLRRFLLPWATPKAESAAPTFERQVPELAGGNWLRGKKIFSSESAACSKCHQVGAAGGAVGPDLSNLIHRDYASVLKDIREPNAAINPDHVAYNVELADGEGFTAVLKSDGRDRLTFADATGRPVTAARKQIKSIKPSTLSLMPEGLAQALTAEQLKDLMTFLLITPLEPAPVEAPNPPPPRGRAEVTALLEAAKTRNPKPETQNAFEVVLCAGPKDHGPGEHDYPLWQKRWAKLLPLADGVKVNTADRWPSARQLKTADVVVFYSNNPDWNAERARELDAFLDRGGGLVYLHYAVDGQKHVDALAQRIGLAWRGGGSKFRHGPLDLKLHPHPLAVGLGKMNFIDESYWQLVGDVKNVELIATGVEEGEPRPLIWTRTQGKGQVFVSIPGHYNWTFDDPLFRLLILRGICWAGGQPMDRLAELSTIGARLTE